MTVKNDLQAISKELKALTAKVEKMIVAVGKINKPAKKAIKAKPVKKVVKAKPAKRAVKPKSVKKAVKTKPVKKTVAKKKTAVTATDTVLGIINRRKKGAGVAVIKSMTGFKDRKIYDIVKSLKKRGKVKSEKMGIYVKA